MEQNYDLYIDVRNEEPPNPLVKVNIVSQILERGEVLKVITNSDSSHKNIVTLISGKSRLELIRQSKKANEFSLYIKKT